MSIVTFARYVEITRDLSTDEITATARLDEAQEMIEEALDRPLALEARTEVVILEPDSSWGYLAYPRSTPITEVPGDAVYFRYDDVTLRSVPPDGSPLFGWVGSLPLTATVTWTGGFTADTLPRKLERAIADLAHALEVGSSAPLGATSVRVGDVAITYEKSEHAGLDAYVPGLWGRIRTFRHRRRLAFAPSAYGSAW